MAVSTPLLERRRKISYTHIILVSEPSFSKHPYIQAQARSHGVSEAARDTAARTLLLQERAVSQPVVPQCPPPGSHQDRFGV